MVFASPIFLFAFLPVILLACLPFAGKRQNFILLIGSLLFYFWGEMSWGWVLVVSILFNYAAGILLSQTSRRRAVLTAAIVANLVPLIGFKYGAFLAENVSSVLETAGAARIGPVATHLPIGISFFTFHALSYLVDIHRERVRPQTNLTAFALYITMFPQLIAGPIIRYHDISDQLTTHRSTIPDFAAGVRRFVLGLGKKVLIANTLARSADAIFAIPLQELTPSLAWAGALLYSLQIYFDFSAYSDMAIGLGRMFGLRFRENFDYPYVARSFTEFWRRWHISLSLWFRDYLYIPLGGNRHGRARTYINLVVVFLLCGLWHGASWTFVVWGLYHGFFLVLERSALGAWLTRLPPLLGRVYFLPLAVVGWVFFRCETLSHAVAHLSVMAGLQSGSGEAVRLGQYLQNDVLLAVAAGVLGSAPIVPWLARVRAGLLQASGRPAVVLYATWESACVLAMAAVFVTSAAMLASGTYNPFIYFRF
jgi:alginate O-acetyltransferase complex protein AlgI